MELWSKRLARRGESPQSGPTLAERHALEQAAGGDDAPSEEAAKVVEALPIGKEPLNESSEVTEAHLFPNRPSPFLPTPPSEPFAADPPEPTDEERLEIALDPYDLRPKGDGLRGGGW